MKLLCTITVTTLDGTSPQPDDVRRALTKQIEHILLVWNDPSLGRHLDATLSIEFP